MDLTGKRILFFSAKAFGIPENIVTAFKEYGAMVDYFDERPANSFIVKALIRINRNIIYYYIDKYHKRIIKQTKRNKYDYIIFIKGESFSDKNIKYLFSLHPESKTIIYHWDSIANNHNALNLLDNFDRVFSFDRYDCCNFGINFLPLFYYKEYQSVALDSDSFKYDFLFVGTTHSDRYRFINKIVSQILSYGGKCFTYFFFQGKIMFYKYKITHKEMRNVPMREFHFSPMKKDQLIELYKQSKIILDIQHPKQTGLTLRTIESLGAQRKLITTNQDIINYDFYNPNNILVVDRTNPIIPQKFIETDYKKIPDVIYKKYSLENWIATLLS